MPPSSPGIASSLLANVSAASRLLQEDPVSHLHAGELHVRRQWARLGEYAPPKTRAAVRRVPLSSDMVKYLTEHKLASRYSKDDEPVFASKSGRPLGHRNATGRGFEVEVRPPARSPQRDRTRLRCCREGSGAAGCFVPFDAPRVRLADDRPRHLLDSLGEAHGPRVVPDHRASLHPPLRPAAHGRCRATGDGSLRRCRRQFSRNSRATGCSGTPHIGKRGGPARTLARLDADQADPDRRGRPRSRRRRPRQARLQLLRPVPTHPGLARLSREQPAPPPRPERHEFRCLFK